MDVTFAIKLKVRTRIESFEKITSRVIFTMVLLCIIIDAEEPRSQPSIALMFVMRSKFNLILWHLIQLILIEYRHNCSICFSYHQSSSRAARTTHLENQNEELRVFGEWVSRVHRQSWAVYNSVMWYLMIR